MLASVVGKVFKNDACKHTDTIKLQQKKNPFTLK